MDNGYLKYMTRAIELAEAGRGNTSPNPMVGAVIMKDDRVVGEGAHEYWGGSHAEVNAISKAGTHTQGAVMVCTLEPCNHSGKTPPCTEAIIEAGIRHVEIGAQDTNPLVMGKGVARLLQAGITVNIGLMEAKVREQNAGYFSLIERGRPRVIAKTAQTINGMVASPARRWITGEESRQMVHAMRAGMDAVMVGIGTVMSDDPHLTVRGIEKKFKEPARVVIDTDLKIPMEANILDGQVPTIIYCGPNAPAKKETELQDRAQVVRVGCVDGWLDLKEVLANMAHREFLDVMVEGGPSIIASMLEKSLIDEWNVFIAPIIEADLNSIPLVPLTPDGASHSFEVKTVTSVGEDVLINLRMAG